MNSFEMNNQFISICKWESILLSSFLAELGDHSSNDHTVETISEFRFLPDDRQTEEFEEQVLQKWSTHK